MGIESEINKLVHSNEINKYMNSNEWLRLGMKLVLVVYAGLVAPKLASSLKPIIDNTVFKVVFFFMLAYLGNVEPTIALLMAVAFVVSIIYMKKSEQQKEGFDGSCSIRY